jgi:DNA-binding CsgD family transcriptional regulator
MMEMLTPDEIYESAFIADKWPKLLGACSDLVGGVGGGLFTANAEVQNWTASSGLKETLDAYVKLKVISVQPVRIFDAGQHSFLTDHDVFTDEEMDNHPLYRDFLRPRGLGWSARTSVRLPTGDNIVMNIERALKDGPMTGENIAALNEMRPHLARAALMSARLQLERARAATDAMTMLGLPALLFDIRGRVLASNKLIEDMPNQIIFRAFGAIALSDKRANTLLIQAIASAAKELHTAPYSFSVCDEFGMPNKIAHIVPICGESRDVFVRSAGMLVLTPVNSNRMPSTDLIQGLFDLTAAEARVARNIAKGETLEQIATSNSVSVNTIRTQLRSILEKTGCHRQQEVATLMNGLSIVKN